MDLLCICVFVAGIDTPKLSSETQGQSVGRGDQKAAKCTTFEQLCGKF